MNTLTFSLTDLSPWAEVDTRLRKMRGLAIEVAGQRYDGAVTMTQGDDGMTVLSLDDFTLPKVAEPAPKKGKRA